MSRHVLLAAKVDAKTVSPTSRKGRGKLDAARSLRKAEPRRSDREKSKRVDDMLVATQRIAPKPRTGPESPPVERTTKCEHRQPDHWFSRAMARYSSSENGFPVERRPDQNRRHRGGFRLAGTTTASRRNPAGRTGRSHRRFLLTTSRTTISDEPDCDERTISTSPLTDKPRASIAAAGSRIDRPPEQVNARRAGARRVNRRAGRVRQKQRADRNWRSRELVQRINPRLSNLRRACPRSREQMKVR